MNEENTKGIIEAILFAVGNEVDIKDLQLVLEKSKDEIEEVIKQMNIEYKDQNRGIEIVKLDNKFQMASKKEYYDYICKIIDKRSTPKLSNAALETLSIIAYNPRISKSEIESIRGVNVDGTMYKLLEYGLIEEAGKLDLPGKPMSYKTTNQFLKMFGYTTLKELPELPRYKLDSNKQIVIDELIENSENNRYKIIIGTRIKEEEKYMSDDKNFVKEITNIDVDFAQWYTDIVRKAELADYTDTKGCIAIRPYGYAIWENIQNYTDKLFKETGVKNAYFPILIPESLLQKEKDHIEGFAPEVAWVTEAGEEKLDERLCIRPTSETIITTLYSKWLTSWRDLPFVYNQWCNVLRWEKETRPFLRSREFLWQEGHTIHETEKEAKERTLQMLEVYVKVAEDLLAIPVLTGLKTETEKFAGAEQTYTIEAMMYDGRALQSGTSHYFGQKFTKPFDVKFQNREGKPEFAYQTSWGISTRFIGAIIMAHGDNRGLKLPPKVAPIQVVIVPIAQHKEGVIEKTQELYSRLKGKFRVEMDVRDKVSPGYKFNDWEMKGVPLRIEMGPRDIENGQCVLVRRDTNEKTTVLLENLEEKITELLDEIQKNMFKICKDRMKAKTTEAHNLEEFEHNMNTNQGFIKAMWCGSAECEAKIKELTAAKSRCMPFVQEKIDTKCVCCGKPADKLVVWGRQY